jgi:hypothetical protein
VGQFRSAGGLVLLGGRSWGLRFPAARTGGINVQDEFVLVVVTERLLGSAQISSCPRV